MVISRLANCLGRLVVFLLATGLQGATLTVYLSPPTNQSSTVAGVATENFNSLALGIDTTVFDSTVGTFEFSQTNKVDALAADQYGGASKSDYIAFGAQSSTSSPITVNLLGPESYFGFWWSAGDSNNGIGFYSGNNLLVHFKTSDIISLLSPTTGKVTALNGAQYTNSQYYGNPNNTTQDSGEPFAYVNFVTSGITFNRIVLDNSGTTSTGFEMDNFSILASAPSIPTNHVLVEQLPAVAPEPSYYACVAAFLFSMVIVNNVKRKRL